MCLLKALGYYYFILNILQISCAVKVIERKVLYNIATYKITSQLFLIAQFLNICNRVAYVCLCRNSQYWLLK